MALFRMRIEAGILFTVEADDADQAVKKATEIVWRALEDGVDVPNVDTEEELIACRAYPNDAAVPEVIDVEA